MIIPNIEEECSTENFNPSLNKEQLKLSFSINDEEDGEEENSEISEPEPLKKQSSGRKKRPRLESIDKPIDGFMFHEEDFVETAMFGDNESPNMMNQKIKTVLQKPTNLSDFLENDQMSQLETLNDKSEGE